MRELKVGDRIDLHELISDGGYTCLKKHGYEGKQAIGELEENGLIRLDFIEASPSIPRTLEDGYMFFYQGETKIIGTLIVKSLK